MLRRAKAALRPLAVRLGLRDPLPSPPPARSDPAGIRTPNPVISDSLPPGVAEAVQRHAERRIALFVLDRKLIERQNTLIARAVHGFFSGTRTFRGIGVDGIARHVADFRDIYLASPITMNDGGANFPSGVNLFLMARCLAPGVIVESGVFKGQSSHFLAAACPRAKIHAFDPDLSGVVHRTPGVTYYAHDWMEADIRSEAGARGLCFFDDHINQAMRIVQAHERGFRHVLVDDSWPIEAPGCGWPPIPSVDMIMGNPLAPGETVQWIESGKIWTYVHNDEMRELCDRARRLIRAAYEVPSLYRECGIAPTSAYKFVELN